MAERGGFEPPVQFYPYNGLANRPFRPLRHLSVAEPGIQGGDQGKGKVVFGRVRAPAGGETPVAWIVPNNSAKRRAATVATHWKGRISDPRPCLLRLPLGGTLGAYNADH